MAFAPGDEHSAPLRRIAAIPYSEGAYPDRVLEMLVRELQAEGVVVAGVLQHDTARRDRTRCDMSLEDIASGAIIGLSEDRGPLARGCRIDERGLAAVAPLIEDALERLGPALLVINKFGKIESEGRGLRQCIVKAAARDLPVIIGVPKRNLDAWNAFAGEFSMLIGAEADEVRAWLRRVMTAPSGRWTGSARGMDGQDLPGQDLPGSP